MRRLSWPAGAVDSVHRELLPCGVLWNHELAVPRGAIGIVSGGLDLADMVGVGVGWKRRQLRQRHLHGMSCIHPAERNAVGGIFGCLSGRTKRIAHLGAAADA